MNLLLLALAVFGHAVFWIGVVNRWHAVGLPRPLIKAVTLLFYAVLAAPIVLLVWHVLHGGWPDLSEYKWQLDPLSIYLAVAALVGLVHLPIWAARRITAGQQLPGVRPGPRVTHDMVQRLGASPARGLRAGFFTRVPWNGLWQLQVASYDVQLSRLPAALEGISICHLSDLHLCGRIDRCYFEDIVRLTNEMDADLIVLTGDICDKAIYIDWLPQLLGPLQARLGKYFILGNHDLRTHDVPRLRDAMRAAGFVDAAGQCLPIADGKLLVAGDERHWFANFPSDDQLRGAASSAALRLLLAHTPDRIHWASARDFDLLLAGHTHGGQVCLPVIGPLVCPSGHGVRYANGFFRVGPTLMHVTRGTASLFPYRLNCPPEIVKLVLRRG